MGRRVETVKNTVCIECAAGVDDYMQVIHEWDGEDGYTSCANCGSCELVAREDFEAEREGLKSDYD